MATIRLLSVLVLATVSSSVLAQSYDRVNDDQGFGNRGFNDRSVQASTTEARTGQAPVRMTRQPDFRIPFHLSPGTRVDEVQLYVSTDQGRQWKLYQRQSHNANGFQFRAPEDGEYWFAVQTIEHRNSQPNSNRMTPELKVVVDTRPPRMDLRVHVDANENAAAEWSLDDPTLAAHSFRLQFQDADGAWREVQIQTPDQRDTRQQWNGRTRWRLDALGAEGLVRAEIYDRAGNATRLHKRVSLNDGAADRQYPQFGSAQDNESPIGTSWNDLKQGITQQLPGWLTGDRDNTSQPATNEPRNSNSWPQDNGPLRSVVRTSVGDRREGFGQDAGFDRRDDYRRDDDLFGTTPSPASRPRITDSPNFELDYELFDVGPRGPRLIELWYTRDRGETWELYGSDRDMQSPIQVQLKREGLYGFLLAVHGYDLPATEAPQDGTPPDIFVQVDWTKPVARITRATAEGQQMVIEWIAEDAMLAEEPISLSYAASPDGPWSPIVSSYRNSGVYRWNVDRRLPSRTFFRLEVLDESGNATADVYDASSSSNGGQSPWGRIRDVGPMRRTAQGLNAFR